MTDFTVGGTSRMSIDRDGRTFVLKRTIDFSATNATAAASPHPLFNIPAKTFVRLVQIDVTTAEGATLTLDLGDGSSAAGFLSNVNGNSVASTVNTLLLTEAAPNTVTAYSNGKYYSADDAIDLILDNDASKAVITFRAICVALSD